MGNSLRKLDLIVKKLSGIVFKEGYKFMIYFALICEIFNN
jgi:hypothetical protein